MTDYFTILRTHIDAHPPSCGDGESVLTMLYEAFSESHPMDDSRIKQDFRQLYEQMNGMTLREMDRILDPVCSLCRDHQRSGFEAGVQIGVRLAEELK